MATLHRRRFHRVLPAVAAAALVALGLGGCSTNAAIDANRSATPTVTLWTWNANNPSTLWTKVEKALADQGTKVNIQVRTINSTSYAAVVQTAMNGGSGPNIFYNQAGESFQTYAAAKLVAPLSGIDTSNISQAALATAEYDGKLYGVPDSADTMSVLYNKQVLAANHLKVPTTWTQFLGEMKTLKSNGVTPMYVMGVQQWMLALQMDAIGASTMPSSYIQDLQDKKASYTDAPYVKTLTAFQQLAPYLESNWQAVGSADNEQETALALGKTAFVIDGIFNVAEVKQANPDVKLGQFLVPSPDGQTPKIDWYPDASFSINAKISNPAVKAAAQKIVKFTATKQFGDLWNSVTGTISPIKGAKMPSTNPLSVQASNWYNSKPITPLFGIRSAMDTPKPDTSNLNNSKTVASVEGIFEAEQNVAVPLLEGKITPQQAAEQVQKAQQWYLSGSN